MATRIYEFLATDGNLCERLLHESDAAAEVHAYEIGRLAYEVRNPNWKESVHHTFACREIDGGDLEFSTPVGKFRIAALRKGGGPWGTDAPVVEICGRLNAPAGRTPWTFQPRAVIYADGARCTSMSGYPLTATRVPSYG